MTGELRSSVPAIQTATSSTGPARNASVVPVPGTDKRKDPANDRDTVSPVWQKPHRELTPASSAQRRILSILLLLVAACGPTAAAKTPHVAPTPGPLICADDAEACYQRALQYATGTPADPHKAAVWYEKACRAGHAPSCSALGVAYLYGSGVELDGARAVELLERGCAGGELVACTLAGTQYEVGEVVTRDWRRAFQLYDKACDGDQAEGCSLLAGLYRRGDGVQEDMARAAKIYKKACALGGLAGCREIGFLYGDSATTQRQTEIPIRAEWTGMSRSPPPA